MNRILEETDFSKVDSVLVFASFNEAQNLSQILHQLAPQLTENHMVVIADDSGPAYREFLEKSCHEAMVGSRASLCFSYADQKSGRGSAVRRSFQGALEQNNAISSFVESDSDGSHRPEDILKMLSSDSGADLLIGSRYSKGSKITGWPIERRIFSKILNLVIPILLQVRSKDLTNGLRRYSAAAVNEILRNDAKNTGFIYLSEVAYLLSKKKYNILDIPIHFENRVYGESTVGKAEITASLAGLGNLIVLRLRDLVRL